MVLTKAELVKALINGESRLNKDDAVNFVEFFFKEIRMALKSGEEVKLAGFGNFRTRTKNARPGRNLKTGEAALVSARRVVTFYASRKLKAKILTQAAEKTKTKKS